jgi:hypothetical protein
MRIFYLSRTPLDLSFGGSIMRASTVKHLRFLGYKVIIVTPNYKSIRNIISSDNILIRQYISIKLLLLLEKLGLINDYLSPWSNYAKKILGPLLEKGDLVISTSGGELGMLQLGNQLMKAVNIKHIFHMHDPIQYSFFEGIWIGSKFHVNRTKHVQNELSLPNKILVTSENTTKYVREINKETCFDYLGIDNFRIISEKRSLNSSYVNIFYAGSFGQYQNPLKHLNNLINIKGVNLHFIGNTDAEKKRINTILLKTNPNYRARLFFHGQMNKSDTDEMIFNKADYILVPLDMQFLKFNFPSKIYDSLNLVTPILFDLPEGSAKKFIIKNNIGIDLTSDKNILLNNIKDANAYELLVNNIISIRGDYKMEDRILQLIR